MTTLGLINILQFLSHTNVSTATFQVKPAGCLLDFSFFIFITQSGELLAVNQLHYKKATT